MVKVQIAENIPQGLKPIICNRSFMARLNRLRKNYDSQARLKEDIPQGLKPAAVLLRLRHD
jgi:hypothetical protein